MTEKRIAQKPVMRPDGARSSWFPTATGTITRIACRHATAHGLKLEPLLKKAGPNLSQINNQRTRIKVRDQIEFLNVVAKELDDDLLGFHLAKLPDLRQMGMLYYVLSSAEKMIETFHRAARYSAIVNDGIVLRCIDGQQFGLSFHYVGVSRLLDRHQIEFWATTVIRVCRQLTGLRINPSVVRFTHRRNGKNAEMKEFLGAKIEFGAVADEVMFDSGGGLLPIVSADRYLSKILIGVCDEAISERKKDLGSFRVRVENAIAPLLPHGKARASEIAKCLGKSERTFARLLSLEGLTFSELLENLRKELASHYLADENLSISQIAWLLGYQELSAFSRAFNRWTGKSPRNARSSIAVMQPLVRFE